MIDFLIRWALTMLSVWVAAYFLDGIVYTGWHALAVAALVLGILNAIIKPVLMLLSLPLLLVTLGLFLLVINALILKLTGILVPGFDVTGFWTAIGGALIISVVNVFTGNSKVKKKASINIKTNRSSRKQRPEPPEGKGPVIDI